MATVPSDDTGDVQAAVNDYLAAYAAQPWVATIGPQLSDEAVRRGLAAVYLLVRIVERAPEIVAAVLEDVEAE